MPLWRGPISANASLHLQKGCSHRFCSRAPEQPRPSHSPCLLNTPLSRARVLASPVRNPFVSFETCPQLPQHGRPIELAPHADEPYHPSRRLLSVVSRRNAQTKVVQNTGGCALQRETPTALQHEDMQHDGQRSRGDGHIGMHDREGELLTKSAKQENSKQVGRDGRLQVRCSSDSLLNMASLARSSTFEAATCCHPRLTVPGSWYPGSVLRGGAPHAMACHDGDSTLQLPTRALPPALPRDNVSLIPAQMQHDSFNVAQSLQHRLSCH